MTYTGLKVSESGKEVVIRDANGRDVRVPKTDIEEFEASKQSLMPDNAISQLTFDQFIDLLAFLRDRTAQESLRGIPLSWWVVGPYPQDLKASFPPEKDPNPNRPVASMKPGETLKWQVRQVGAERLPRPAGGVQRRSHFGLRDDLHLFAEGAEGEADGGVGRPAAGVDQQQAGSRVAQNRDAKPDADKVDVELAAGWNVVLAKVTNSVATHGLYLRLAGGEGLRVSMQKD